MKRKRQQDTAETVANRRARYDLEENVCRPVGRAIAESLPKGVGFLLVVFDFGEDGNLAYMSNAQRRDTLQLLKELQEKLSLEDA